MHRHADAAVLDVSVPLGVPEVVVVEGLQSAEPQLVEDPLGPNSIEKIWLEFWLEKPLEFWLEIPYTKKMFKNG